MDETVSADQVPDGQVPDGQVSDGQVPDGPVRRDRRALGEAAEWFAATVRSIGDNDVDPDSRALGVWSIRDLVGHTSRALLTLEQYLRPESSASPLTTGDYYREVRSERADPAAVAERGRAAGRDLGDDLAGSVEAIVRRVLPLVESLSDDARVLGPVGEMTLAAYLPTRIFELVVHTGDLRAAAGLDREPPHLAASAALGVLGILIAQSPPGEADALLRSLTGRGPLPEGFSLL